MDVATQQRLQSLIAQFSRKVRLQIESNKLDQHGIDADDIEQEVRIRLWKTLERDPKAELPASYVQKVVVSTLVDAVRRAQARPIEQLPEGEDQWVDWQHESRSPDRSAGDAQHLDRIRECLNALPVRRRVPVQLYLQGYALQEIADLSELALDAARKLVYRGLEETKQRLRALGLGEFDD